MYQVLYRKYRPKVFADVYGQEHVTSTLKNEIKENRIAHAYLFTGSRGTGKTTCAKILAKAVNCENSVDGEPCNECEVCKGLDSGTIYDVVEIDAASNNGVDNIRDLREEANYTPSRGKYRVYIIDEVHMLSTGAFNALLKTLEEPPAHVIFILATTEVHKLPATILSRCQRFDFKRIQPETMSVRLKQVAQLEGMELDDDAAILIARIADGALRDGLSILDQCAGRSKKIDSALVSEVAGLAGREALYKLTDCICTQNSSSAMTVISELYQNSYDMERLCVEMINHLRNFLIVKTVKDSRGLIICTDDEYNSIILSAENFTLENVIFALDLFQDALTKIKTGANARVELEMAFVKLCEPKLDVNIDSLVDRISKLERAVNRGVNVSQQPAVVESAKPVVAENKQEVKAEKAVEEIKNDTLPPIASSKPSIEPKALQGKNETAVNKPQQTVNTDDSNTQYEFEHWGDFMDVIHKQNIALFGVLAGSRGYIRGEYFLIDSPNPTIIQFLKTPTYSKAIKQALYDVTGQSFKLGIFKKKATDAPKRDLLEDLIHQAEDNIKINFE
ncbi:dNA polymerase III subunit gamma and tau [Firmicutes bacterium CAG:341]|uniref:DNA polymerase III subunit gamma/tau n=1 Tax=Eubacterium sp. TaxID=142586 RepID=UPI000337A546|nr:dNA polymerase III subunit gamma and tau [Firmicutes bacterium CAG:341]